MKASKRTNPNYKLKIRLLQEVQMKCPFCSFKEAAQLEHHHIDGNPSNTVFENLISICPNCHSKVESGLIIKEEVERKKEELSVRSNYQTKGSYKFDNFRIHDNRVGIIKKGMTIDEVYKVLPNSQIRKTITYGEHSGEDMYDSYEVYDADGEHLISLGTAEHGTIDSPIELVSIHSNLFHTLTGVRIGGTIHDIIKNQSILAFEPDIDHIHFRIEWLNAICSVSKKQLKGEWWDEKNKKVFISKVNEQCMIEHIAIHW